MFKSIFIFIMYFILFLMLADAKELETLLNDYAKQADLSKKTKEEAVGHLTIFTRQDIDKMQVKDLKELIDYVPYIRYNEDANGQSSPFYFPYQTNHSSMLRVYLNDKELFNPYYGNSVQIFGQMSLGSIDHIEIYSGIPSYKFGIEGSMCVIRLYTKKPSRENTTVLGMMGGTYGAGEVYAYSAYEYDDFSYLLHVSGRNIDRKKLYNDGFELSRDQKNRNLFAQFNKDNHSLELHLMSHKADNFIGESWGIHPERNDLSNEYFSAGWSYISDDESFKIRIDAMRASTDKYQLANDAIGINPFTFPPSTYKEHFLDVKEEMVDIHVSKEWNFENNSFLAGLRGRYKKFKIEKFKIDGMNVPITTNYDSDFISSLYAENEYMLDEQNMLIVSFKVDDSQRNGGTKNENPIGGRFGYTYNEDNYFLKGFIFYGETPPEPYLIAYNSRLNAVKLDKERAASVSFEAGYKIRKNRFSVTLARSYYKSALYYNGMNYDNSESDIIYDTMSIFNSYTMDEKNRIDTNIWLNNKIDQNSNTHDISLGGYVNLFNSFGKWDFVNSLRFYGLDFGTAYNYNIALTYNYDRHLSFFIKGTNLFNDALKTDYYRINKFTGVNTELNDVPVYDRTLWLGWEYQF